MPVQREPLLAGNYITQCTYCGARGKFQYPSGAGLKVGDMIAYDSTDSSIGRCHLCLRHKLKIIQQPDPPPPPPVLGFDKVPEK